MSDLTYWIVRHSNQVFISTQGESGDVFPLARASDFDLPHSPLLIGQWQGKPCYAIEADQIPAHLVGELRPVRSIFGSEGAEAFALAGRATQMIDWQKNHQYCGHCGTPTIMKTTEFAMECPSCRLIAYPRISPAVMVLVDRGDGPC